MVESVPSLQAFILAATMFCLGGSIFCWNEPMKSILQILTIILATINIILM